MRKFLWLAIAIILVVAGWSAGWLWAAGEVRNQVALLAEADGESAPRLTCDTFNVSGFPFRFDLDCVNGTVVDQDLTVTVPELRATLLAYSPTHMIFSAKGPFAYADAFTGSQRRLDFARLDGSLRLASADLLKGFSGEGWRIARLSVQADELIVTDVVAGDVFEASARHVEAHLIDIPERLDRAAGTATLAQYVAAEGLTLPGLNIHDGNLTLESQLTALPADLRDFAAPDAIRNWQARGGILKIAKLAGNQASPEESFDIDGELSLSGGGFAQGQLNYRTRAVLDRLAQVVPAMSLAMLRGAPQPDGTYANSLTIADGQVKLLTFVFMELPALF